jgi:protein-S-isoprenylcysteine O-methyltransferase Ste14
MRASQLEFRLRMGIMAAIISFGFWSPWIEAWEIGRRISLLEWSALELSRLGLFRFTVATPTVVVFAAIVAALAAALRVWGTAWLGPGVVNNIDMKAGVVMAGGPFRYVRNPLYLGTWLMVVAMSFDMPVTGALFAVIVIAFFLLRLILGEEAFLAQQLGEPFQIYLRSVPRLFPRLRTNLPAVEGRPHWGRAVLAETNPIGVFLIVAVLSWRYENNLMVQAFLISFGVSLVTHALLPGDNISVICAFE